MWTALAVAVAVLALCVVMAVHSVSGMGLAGCAAGSACDDVMSGRWSRLFGLVPVSALAAGLYLALIFCLLCVRLSKDGEVVGLAMKLLPVMAGAVVGSAVWFIALMLFEEDGVCRYCLAAHSLGLLEAVLLMAFGWERDEDGRIVGCENNVVGKESKCCFAGKWGMFGAGVILAAVLAVVQVLTAPSFVYQAGSVEEPLPLVEAPGAPVIGDASRAEAVIDVLFDYQCSHCQKVHSLLPEVVSRLDGRVAFVLCPCPLSAKCNPYVPREDVRFEGSCELAKIGLAVFDIDPEAFAKYDKWMFEAGEDGWWPRGAGDARAFAEGLVGAGRLAEALDSQWLYERLLQTYELFGRTSAGGQGGIPRFICSEKWVVPEADSVEGLVDLLASQFGVR